jgi:hypothetical protein
MEDQMASALEATQVVPGEDFKSEETKRRAEQTRATQTRQKQALNLQRQNILAQEACQPGRRVALQAALAQVEGQIAQLN